jgi:hypothetical protein
MDGMSMLAVDIQHEVRETPQDRERWVSYGLNTLKAMWADRYGDAVPVCVEDVQIGNVRTITWHCGEAD